MIYPKKVVSSQHNYNPKYILTLDDDPMADYDGVKRINALEWLVGFVPSGKLLAHQLSL